LGRVVFDHDNALVKIYKQDSDGSKGDVQSDDWLYVQGIKLVETPKIKAIPRLFASRNRVETIGYERLLTIEKFHYYKVNDWSLAKDVDQDYWIEIVFTGDNINYTETYTCKYCRYNGQSLNTREDPANDFSKGWIVGTIT